MKEALNIARTAFYGLGEGVWLEEEGLHDEADRPFVFRRVLHRWPH